jgi:hypothetical protein
MGTEILKKGTEPAIEQTWIFASGSSFGFPVGEALTWAGVYFLQVDR